jgi:hypothetical protein
MRHEFSVEEMGEDGLVPIDDDRAADIVGASIRFHFTDGNLDCKVLYASFNARGNHCPRNSAVECDGCACLITDQGEIMMCKDSNTFLKRIEQGDEIDE